MNEQRSQSKSTPKRRARYVPCSKSPDGKHRWERITRNQFEKCQVCGEPRFAVRLPDPPAMTPSESDRVELRAAVLRCRAVDAYEALVQQEMREQRACQAYEAADHGAPLRAALGDALRAFYRDATEVQTAILKRDFDAVDAEFGRL